MIDVVGAEAGAHQLLEQIGLFVRALGRAEAGQRIGAVAVADFLEAGGGAVERLFPGRLAEMRPRIRRIDELVRHLRHAVLADHRLQQALRIVHVVEAEAALHAKPVLVGRAVLAFDGDDLVVLDLVGELAADAAIRAHAVAPCGRACRDRRCCRRPSSPASARRSGRPARIRRRRRRSTAPIGSSKSNTIFSLWPRPAMPMTSLTCTSRQARTQRLHWMQASRLTAIAAWLRSGAGFALALGEAAGVDPHCDRPSSRTSIPDRARLRRAGLVGDQQFGDHLARGLGAIGRRLDLHASAGLRMQLAASTRSPSISTMQARQLPSAR